MQVGQEEEGADVRGAATAHPLLMTPMSEATPTKTPWLGGLSVTELATRVMKEVREEDCLGSAAQLNQPIRDSYTHAASWACASRAMGSTAAVTSGA